MFYVFGFKIGLSLTYLNILFLDWIKILKWKLKIFSRFWVFCFTDLTDLVLLYLLYDKLNELNYTLFISAVTVVNYVLSFVYLRIFVVSIFT